MSTRLAVGVIGQNIVIDCGTHEEAIRLCETIASVITGREALPTDVPILRLTGEQMGSIDPPLSEDWFCDFDEYEEFVPLRALAEREAQCEALLEAAIQYLASDGSHGLYDAGWMVRARHSLVALVGGVEPIEAARDWMMTVYGEPIAPPAALAETPKETR